VRWCLLQGGISAHTGRRRQRQMPVDSVLMIDAEGYSNPGALPEGDLLIVGSGQTGCQLAEECFEAGRNVYLACGRAPWVPRRIEGRDVLSWILAATSTRFASPTCPVRALGSSRTRNSRAMEAGAISTIGRSRRSGSNSSGDSRASKTGAFTSPTDLHASVAFGDARYADLRDLIAANCAARSVPAPAMPDPRPSRRTHLTALTCPALAR